MALIYVFVAVVGAQSRGVFPVAANGGENICDRFFKYYFGKPVDYISADFAVACLKTAIGLVTSCGETFERYFRTDLSCVGSDFSLLSFLIANVGLDAIIAYSLPVLISSCIRQ